MSKLRIKGGNTLKGTIPILGAKNAALPLIVTGLLTPEPFVLTNVPDLADILTLSKLIRGHGGTVHHDKAKRELHIHVPEISSTTAEYELVSAMRASILVLGPLLAREHNARVALPGGCAIGSRPVDMHISALEEMGATFEQDGGYLVAKAPKGGLQGADISFKQVSVGASENLLMAAALAKGTTRLINVAREPEVVDLANCLVSMGVKIDGIGTTVMTIEGQSQLSGTKHAVVADRIEAGTYAIAAAMTGGDVLLDNVQPSLMEATLDAISRAGVTCTPKGNGIRFQRSGALKAIDVATKPFPGFATDMQAQFMTLMTIAEGESIITETIFENRFMHVPELRRMGAKIHDHGKYASIEGVETLNGAAVQSTDLRASAALVIAGLVAEGETFVSHLEHMDRGYDDLEGKLRAVGADIERLEGVA